jgi:predicted neuraminidase
VVVPLDETRALALLRNTGHPSGAVLSQRSDDAGLRWSPVAPTELPNPDAAVAALRVADDLILLVYNDQSAGRGNLSLAVSRDEGESWTAVHAFEDGRPNAEYSYPWLSMDSRGAIHLAYTWHRTHIKHATFNEAWVRSLLP